MHLQSSVIIILLYKATLSASVYAVCKLTFCHSERRCMHSIMSTLILLAQKSVSCAIFVLLLICVLHQKVHV